MKYTYIPAGTATTVCHGNACTLEKIIINTKGASSNTLTVYDNASAGSGTKIAVIDTTASVVTLHYGVRAQNGITVVSATGTGADLTVVTS